MDLAIVTGDVFNIYLKKKAKLETMSLYEIEGLIAVKKEEVLENDEEDL